MSAPCSPHLYLDFFFPPSFAPEHVGLLTSTGYLATSSILMSLPSVHRVTKGTQPMECHLSAGGCGVLYQATGEGLGRCSTAQGSWKALQHTLTCHHSSSPGSVLTWLSL